MSKDTDYKVFNIFLKEVEFKVLILQIPKNEIEDKLAYLAREKGNITRSFYEDFILATCVANINQLLYHIGQQQANPPDLMKVREELISIILSKNVNFDPDNLIINSNYVVKIKDGKLADDEKKLTDNKNWDTSYYDDINKMYGQQPPMPNITSDDSIPAAPTKKNKTNVVKDINNLSYEIKQKWWKRIGQYVSIKCFSVDDAESIFSKNFFHNRTSFGTYIVSICVDKFEELFSLLDNMGIPNRVAPPILMNELYELCRSGNEFLTYENALEMNNNELGDGDDTNKKKTASSGAMGQLLKKKGKQRKFKNVSKQELLKLGDSMKVFLVGQDKAVDSMTEAIQRASIGLKDPNRPIGSFLFAGRTGVGKCVEKGTFVFSEHGIKPIDSFCNGNKLDALEVNVCGIDGINKTSYIYKEGTKPGRTIHTNEGYELGGSLIHPIIVLDEHGNKVFKQTNELTTDDYVAIQYNQNYFSTANKKLNNEFIKNLHYNTVEYETPTSMNSNLAYYIGLLIGDGSLSTDKCIGFTNKDKQLVKYFYDLSYNLFGVRPNVSSDRYGYYISSRYLYDFFKYSCGLSMTLSKNKEIPFTILESSKECIVSFIQGLMDTDGYFEEAPGTVGITLTSKKLIKQLQVVLLNFGIISSVKHRLVKYNESFNDAWVLNIRSRFAIKFFEQINFRLNYKKDKYNLIYSKTYNPNKDIIPNIHNVIYRLVNSYKLNRNFYRKYRGYYKGYRKPSRKKLKEILGSLRSLIGKPIEQHNDFIYLSTFIYENVFWSKITNIVDKDEMDLYDFTVPKTHSFISNGFISHNTLATKVLADELIKGRDNMVTIDCSEYSSDHEYAKLIGAPSGYVGYEAGGILTNAVMRAPFTVVVFDEVEKASTKVHELLLQILEEGRLTDGKGKSVSFKDTVVILTSNVGVKEVDAINKTIGFGDVSKLTDKKKDSALNEALKRKFKPEFLNRIDAIVNFKNLTKKDYMRIIDIELYKLNDNLRSNDTDYKELELKFDKKIKNFIYKSGIDKEYGARPLKRCIEKYVATPLAKKLLEEDVSVDSIIAITAIRGKTKFEVEDKIEEVPFYMTGQYNTDAVLELKGEK